MTNIIRQEKSVVASFATSMRAASCVEWLFRNGISATLFAPAWTNRKLQPPRFQVLVSPENLDAAKSLVTLCKW